jgi:fucose 4-O-acetylase-like acetyltransferase
MSQSVSISHSGHHRIEYFDLLKGIAIFLVVMGHALVMCIRQMDAALIFKIISEVHMPVFFFISGYFTFKVSSSGRAFASPDLWRRFRQLMIPFFIVSALFIWYYPHSHLLSPFSPDLPHLYCAYWKDGYWFTLCLFEMFLLYWPFSRLLSCLKSFWQQVLAIVIVYAVLVFLASYVSPSGNYLSSEDSNFDVVGFGLLARFFPIFMMGVLAKSHADDFRRLCSSGIAFTVAVVLFIVAFFVTVYPWDFPSLPSWFPFVSRPFEHFGIIIIAFAAVIPWSNKEYAAGEAGSSHPSVVARYFNFLGNKSLGIYLLHFFFLFPLTALQQLLKDIGLAFVPLAVIAACIAFAVIAVTLFVIYLIERSRLLAALIIGKV